MVKVGLKVTSMRLYDRDFLEWTEATVQAIRTGRWNDIDREALAEEIEDLGKRDRREVISRLQVLLQHLLKCKYQPEQQSSSCVIASVKIPKSPTEKSPLCG